MKKRVIKNGEVIRLFDLHDRLYNRPLWNLPNGEYRVEEYDGQDGYIWEKRNYQKTGFFVREI